MSAKPPTISPATPDDATGIAAVQHDTWLATYPNAELGITLAAIKERVSGYQSSERIAKWRSIISEGEEYISVAKDGHRVIGFSAAQRGDSTNHVVAIYVLPQYHGTGAAQQLMDAALAWLGNGKPVIIEVASYNERAIRFYRKYGFLPTGQTGQSGEIPTIFMQRGAAGPNFTVA